VVEITKAFSGKTPGTVVGRSPTGKRLELGAVLMLIVAKPLPTIPAVVGMNSGAAKQALQSRGFEIQVSLQFSDAPKGTVVSQTPPGGTRARPGREVRIVVSKGKNCTPGYSPCLPPASDYDCAGGSGDGPKYTGRVTVRGSDPYGLDADGDGVGCED
jgi:beta-lactam-binding protein with PASTA domain